jgi:hypothetical protein
MSRSTPKTRSPGNLQPLIVALAFISLVGLIFLVTMNRMSNTDDFLKVWAAVGPIVGVVTGLIPTYFFHTSAESASSRAEEKATENGRLRGMMQMKGIDPDKIGDGVPGGEAAEAERSQRS